MKVNEEQRKKIDTDERDNPLMTVRTIKYFCYKDLLFDTPELNEKLYLHYKGFKKIQSLEYYPNLVTIWLNNNCISKIQGLNSLCNLICLYLNNNAITKIQNLQGLERLSVLHLAHNKIEKIEGLGCLKALNFLNISENFLNSPQSIIGLQECNVLTSVDLSKNQLQNSQELFEVICSLSKISCLSMKNTPISKSFKNYRKKLIAALQNLKYLDDRPIKQIDHRLAQAWVKGGPQFENQERMRIALQIQQQKRRQNKEMSERVTRQKRRHEEIQQLERHRKELQEQGEDEQSMQQLAQVRKRLEILKDGPKGFQASITKTSIKVLNVSEQEQEQTINKYFLTEKLKIQENLLKIQSQDKGVNEFNLQNEELHIVQKVKAVLNIKNTQSHSYQQKWDPKYQPILVALLIKYKFNFQKVLVQFNQIVADVSRKMFRVFNKFSLADLQNIWTNIQIRRRQHLN